MGIATCDKGLPAMMMALAGARDLPGIVVPGGVTLPAIGGEDAGKVQTIGARFAHGLITLDDAADDGLPRVRHAGRRLPVPRHGGDVAGGRRGARAWRCRTARWRRRASRSGWTWRGARRARWCGCAATRHAAVDDPDAGARSRTRCCVHAAFGGSTNLLLHIPAHRARRRAAAADGRRLDRGSTGATPRLVDALPNGPRNHPTVQVFLAGGVPEVMLHLREHGPAEPRRADRDGRDAGRGARLVGGERPAARGARAPAGDATASIPTT